MPEVDRALPPYVQIANHYRDAILSGALRPGAKLPSLAELAETWGVAPNTAAKAMGHLQVEGAVYTSPRGTFVAEGEVITRAPSEHIRDVRRHRESDRDATVEVTVAESIPAPNYVAELLDIEPGGLVIRREEISYRRTRPVMLSVDWIPASDVMETAALLVAEPIEGGTLGVIERATQRDVIHGRDHIRGRAADDREAKALRLPIGSPILAGVHVWSDDDGVILYGEWVLPPDQVISYEYQSGEK